MKSYQVYAGLWFGLLVIAIANGALRELVYGPLISNLAAHQLSTFTGSSAFFLYTWLVAKRWPLSSGAVAWKIGFMWLLMTVLFETGMVLFMQGGDISVLLHSYNIFAGQLWVLVLVTALISPFLVFSLNRQLNI